MSPFDAFMALILGVSISILDSWILSGPHLGLVGILLSFFIGALSWFAGTAAVHWIGTVIDRREKKYRMVLWILTFVSSILIVAVIILYFLFFVAEKAEYSYGEIALHLSVLFVLATAIRAMIYAAKTASDA